jgi:pimeloyl-ACP methyl ester carboxylesterase
MAPRAYAPSHEPIFKALLALDLPAFQTRTQLEDALAKDIPSLNLRRFLLKNLGRDANGQFIWKMNLGGIQANYGRLCAAVDSGVPFGGPTLFLRGGWSDYVVPTDEPDIRRLFPAAEIQTIAASSHWVHADAPEEFVKRVLGFL